MLTSVSNAILAQADIQWGLEIFPPAHTGVSFEPSQSQRAGARNMEIEKETGFQTVKTR